MNTSNAPSELKAHELAFLDSLKKMAANDVSYFEIERVAIGPGSPALQGWTRVTREIIETPLYKAAVDIVTRAGIAQGLILAPEHEKERNRISTDRSQMSVTQAADTLGLSRAAVHKAIKEKRIDSAQYGNVILVDRKSVERYRTKRKPPSQDAHNVPEMRISSSSAAGAHFRMAAKRGV
jgi:excisionase family DNA binding protein